MRGFGSALSRLPAARALLAGAAMLAGASAPTAYAQDAEEVALAMPRIAPAATPKGGGGNGALPRPLSPADEAQVRRIFALQEAGDLAGADAAMASVAGWGDHLLAGHVLADRLLARLADPQPGVLQNWLGQYADHSDAPAIHAALAARLPRGTALPPLASFVGAAIGTAAEDDGEPIPWAFVRNPALDRTVHEWARAGRVDAALRHIKRTRGLDTLYASQLRAEVARILFTQGQDGEAFRLADQAFRRAGGQLALPAYIAGLAAWRQNRPDEARPLFEAAARAILATPNQRAAAGFWAARAYQRGRDPAAWESWMRRAAREGHVFYGLLAQRALGEEIRLEPVLRGTNAAGTGRGTAGEAELDAVAAEPGGRRAFALLQVGQRVRAEAELRLLWTRVRGQQRPALARAVVLAARLAGLTDLIEELSPQEPPSAAPGGSGRHVALPRLRPAGGFRTDPALIYALTRLESNFDPTAISPAGARGLMQIMPGTASYLVKGETTAKAEDMANRLHDPALNLEMGQRYLLHLSALDLVGGDLIRLLASYNAGPGSFGRWVGQVQHGGDPLLFIESIPTDETRAYVPRVLTWNWIYAARLSRPAASLEDLAAGRWPRFQALPAHAEITPRLH